MSTVQEICIDNIVSLNKIILFLLIVVVDHYTLMGNCPPTPPLSQHFALSEN